MNSTLRKAMILTVWVVLAAILGGCTVGTAPDTDSA